MKKLVIGMLAMATCIFSAKAQETGKMEHPKHAHGKGMMLKGVNLTADQKEQMKTNRNNTRSQLADLNKNEDITVREYKSRKAAIMNAQKEQMENLLTPDQKSQLAQNKKDWQTKREAMASRMLDKMKTRLNLSDDQVAKIKAGHEAEKAKAQSIRDNNQLSQAQKKEQLMALRQEQKDSFKQLLTPDQISKMEELRKDRMERHSRK